MYKANDERYNSLPARRVGGTGLQLPLITLGLWRHFSSADPLQPRKEVILDAFDNGVFSFDCANHYGWPDPGSSEKLLGDVLATDLKPYRQELVITTKVGYEVFPGPYGIMGSRKSILQGIDASLKRLQTDYVDIYYMHRFDPETDLEETCRALDQVTREGKALYIGISNFDNEQTKKAIDIFDDLGTPFVANQFSYNMLNQTAKKTDLLKTLAEADRGLVAYGPLAEGLLSDRYLSSIPDDFPIHETNKELFKDGKPALVAKLNALNDIAKSRNQSLSQMALAWLVNDPTVASVIIGTTNTRHLVDDLQMKDNLDFSHDELDQIDKIVNG